MGSKSPKGDLNSVSPFWQLGRITLSTKGQVFLDGCFLFAGQVIGGCKLLCDFFSQQVFKELGLLDAGFSSEASGLDLYLSVI